MLSRVGLLGYARRRFVAPVRCVWRCPANSADAGMPRAPLTLTVQPVMVTIGGKSFGVREQAFHMKRACSIESDHTTSRRVKA
jgi:hypothetical protein